MSPVCKGLRCKEVPQAVSRRKGVHVCEVCFGPLEVEYDYEAMEGESDAGVDQGYAAEPVAVPRFAAVLYGTEGGVEFRLDAV